MSEINTSITTLRDLLDYKARKFSSAEIQLMSILPEWIGKASAVQLKTILQRYLDFVKSHVESMDIFFEEEGISSLSSTNLVMHSFIEETNVNLADCGDPEVKDACLLACIQGINHYKISTYGTAAAFAKVLGMEKQAGLFHRAEINEKHIDDRLSQLAEFEINSKARAPVVLPG